MRHLAKLSILLLLLLAVGCYVSARVTTTPGGASEPSRARPVARAATPEPAPSPAPSPAPAPTRPADTQTATCTTSADCPEGQGCFGDAGCDAAWTCQPRRPCTRDLVPFCGCDGQTFRSSSTCITRPYSHRGPCEATGAQPGPPPPFVGTRPRPAPTPAPANPPDRAGPVGEGGSCQSSAECADGLSCLGNEGCARGNTCQPRRPCTLDLAPFCGCDGQTFRGSSTCPPQSWAHRGACRPSDGTHPAPGR